MRVEDGWILLHDLAKWTRLGSLQPAACTAFLGEIQERKLVVMEGHSRVIILGDVHV